MKKRNTRRKVDVFISSDINAGHMHAPHFLCIYTYLKKYRRTYMTDTVQYGLQATLTPWYF